MSKKNKKNVLKIPKEMQVGGKKYQTRSTTKAPTIKRVINTISTKKTKKRKQTEEKMDTEADESEENSNEPVSPVEKISSTEEASIDKESSGTEAEKSGNDDSNLDPPTKKTNIVTSIVSKNVVNIPDDSGDSEKSEEFGMFY
ncbi:unnamed protein product [Rhizophagus irregularis]|nr:unnamed protein product [Rhizophagus irregularis]CAB4495399.1 unnamed protein product [Rhizophagus irregularis]